MDEQSHCRQSVISVERQSKGEMLVFIVNGRESPVIRAKRSRGVIHSCSQFQQRSYGHINRF